MLSAETRKQVWEDMLPSNAPRKLYIPQGFLYYTVNIQLWFASSLSLTLFVVLYLSRVDSSAKWAVLTVWDHNTWTDYWIGLDTGYRSKGARASVEGIAIVFLVTRSQGPGFFFLSCVIFIFITFVSLFIYIYISLWGQVYTIAWTNNAPYHSIHSLG